MGRGQDARGTRAKGSARGAACWSESETATRTPAPKRRVAPPKWVVCWSHQLKSRSWPGGQISKVAPLLLDVFPNTTPGGSAPPGSGATMSPTGEKKARSELLRTGLSPQASLHKPHRERRDTRPAQRTKNAGQSCRCASSALEKEPAAPGPCGCPSPGERAEWLTLRVTLAHRRSIETPLWRPSVVAASPPRGRTHCRSTGASPRHRRPAAPLDCDRDRAGRQGGGGGDEPTPGKDPGPFGGDRRA